MLLLGLGLAGAEWRHRRRGAGAVGRHARGGGGGGSEGGRPRRRTSQRSRASRTDPHPRSLTAPWSRPSRYLPTCPGGSVRPTLRPSRPAPPRPGAGRPSTPPRAVPQPRRHQALSSLPGWYRPSGRWRARPACSSSGPDRSQAGLRAPQSAAP